MRVILLDHKRYCLINKMVLARAAYNFAEGDLGTRLYLPPPQAPHGGKCETRLTGDEA